MAVEESPGFGPTVGGLEKLLDEQPAYVDVEEAMAADRLKALADASSTQAALPPHAQLGLDPGAQARHDQMLEDSYEQCRKITAHYAKTFYFGAPACSGSG